MKNMILEDKEKNSIISLYKFNQKSLNDSKNIILDLNEEKNKIKSLMNLNLISESVNPSSWIDLFKEVECLKPLLKSVDSLTDSVGDVAANLSRYSAKLRSAGITNADELYLAASKWMKDNIGSYKYVLDGDAAVNRYLLDSGAFREVEEGLVRESIGAMNTKVNKSLDDLAGTMSSNRVNINTDGTPNTTEVNITTMRDEVSVDTGDLSVDALEKKSEVIGKITASIDETTSKIDRRIAQNNAKKAPNRSATDDSYLESYTKIKNALAEVRSDLQKQKAIIDDSVKSKKVSEQSDASASWGGRVYEPINLNAINKILLKIGVDRFAPLFYAFSNWLIRVVCRKSLNDEFIGAIAKLNEFAQRARNFEDVKNFQNEQEMIQRYLRSLMDAMNGKSLNVPKGNAWDWVKEISGLGKLGDIETTWKEFVGILERQVTDGKITNTEKLNIIEDIKNTYGNFTKEGQRVSMQDLSPLEGLVKFKHDLMDLAEINGFTLKDSQLTVPIKGDFWSGLINTVKSTYSEIFGTAFKNVIGNFVYGIVKITIREAFIGLPANPSYYLKPFMRNGVNVKSFLIILLKLSITKSLGTLVFGGIAAYFEMLGREIILGFSLNDEETKKYQSSVMRQKVWEDWKNEVAKYNNLEIVSIVTGGIDRSEEDEYKINPVSGRRFLSDASNTFGPIKFRLVEATRELLSVGDNPPTAAEIDAYGRKQVEKKEKMMNDDVKQKHKDRQKLYYSKTEEEQFKDSDMDSTITQIGKLKNINDKTKKLLDERLFVKVKGTGLIPPSGTSKEELKKYYSEIKNYNGYRCICKKEITYNHEYVKVKGEQIEVTIPVCNDYYRFVNLNEANFTKNTQLFDDKDGYYYINRGAAGFLIGNSAKINNPADVKDWRPINKLSEFMGINESNFTLKDIIKNTKYKRNDMILENNSGKKFGDDNFKHWKDTFTFKAIDEKNPGQYKEVKINMEDVMDRINHYRKKYDEDDAFVRAVIDTHEDVVKVMFTKDLAHLQETHKPLGLALILQQISESRGEMEIWSVARPANGNWFLVKGDYTPKQMVTMDLQKNEPRNKETKVVTRVEDDLKKKEISAIQKLKNDEKSGLEELPIKVREKVKEKISRGWTTEVPFETFDVYYKKSEINSAFNEKIKIYKLIPSNEFFNSLIKNSSRIRTKRGFCKSISNITNEFKMTESQQKIADHILNTCNRMYGNQKLKKYKPVNQND